MIEAPTDEELLRRVAAGDEKALAMLYDRYGRPAYSLSYRILGDEQEAADVVQEAFLNVWRMSGSFDDQRGSARSWLLSVIHHRAIDASRRRRSRPPMNGPFEPDNHSRQEDGVWRHVATRLDRQSLRSALDRIPREQRQAIELAYFGGYTREEIAELTQVPLGTVKGRIRIGVDKLRDALSGQEVGV